MADMDKHRDRLHSALADVLAKRQHMKQVRGQLRERVGQQLDTMAEAEETVGKSQQDDPNVLVHRRHVGLLDEKQRLLEAERTLAGVGDE